MIKYVFFDLDGTLLGMDNDKFISLYLVFLHQCCFDNEKVSLREAYNIVWNSLNKTIDDLDSSISNIDKFYKYFKTYIEDGDFNDYYQKFEKFYNSKFFDYCQEATFENKNMVEAVALLKQKGYQLVIATNPFFPKVAIKKRIEWAGLDINDFIFVTYGEESHFLKPHLEYYTEILEKLNIKNGSEVLMVGNDVEEDMIASKLGMETYLIKDCMISRNGNEKNLKNQGNSADFLKYIKEFM